MGGIPQGSGLPNAIPRDPYDFSSRYNTKLTPEEERAFLKSDMAKDVYDYDARGAWRELEVGTMKRAENGHIGDKYKKPNHKTFSNESIYSGVDGYEGGRWVKDRDGKYVAFIPGRTNLYTRKELERYFKEREPEIRLDDRRISK